MSQLESRSSATVTTTRPTQIMAANSVDELTSPDRSRRMIAEMLEMVRAAVPAVSASAERIAPDGRHQGHSTVYRGAPLRVTPDEVRHEYVHHTESEDPFHPRLMLGTDRTLTGTHDLPANWRTSRSCFVTYAQEVDVPHMIRLFLRVDGSWRATCGWRAASGTGPSPNASSISCAGPSPSSSPPGP